MRDWTSGSQTFQLRTLCVPRGGVINHHGLDIMTVVANTTMYFKFIVQMGILAFQFPGLDSYSLRATASYVYEGLIAADFIIC